MQLQDDIDFTTLNWVKQELDETLKQARLALEGFVEDPADTSLMRFCATYLHQVQGTLRMVELYGASMVVEEMERLANALLDSQIRQKEEAYSVLMRGIVQLPDYLERLQSGHKDIPIVLLPLLNDLRACRGEKLLSESVLFSPDLAAPLPPSADGAKQAIPELELSATVARLRTNFQVALLRWFRNPKLNETVLSLATTLDRLKGVTSQEEVRRLWWIAGGLLDAVRVGGVDASVTLKLLFGRIDREIKRLADVGEAGFRIEPPRELVKNLLYYIAHSTVETERTQELKKVYRLDQLLPTEKELDHAKGSLGGKNRALLDTVGSAIKEDLMRVKDALDLYLRTGDSLPGNLASQADVLDRVADTLGMLGLGVPRRVVQEQRQVLVDIAAGGKSVDESALLDVAGALLYVEASLDENINTLGASADNESELVESNASGVGLPQAEVRKILETLIKEACTNIQQAKHDVVAFVESPWDHDKVTQIPRLLDEIKGAMQMLGLNESAQLLHALSQFIELELLASKRVPSNEQMDRLADALASIEYYLESVRDLRGGRDKILEVTKRSLASLGYWPITDGAKRPLSSELDEIVGASIEQADIPANDEQKDFDSESAVELSSAVEIHPGKDVVDLVLDSNVAIENIESASMQELNGLRLAETELSQPIQAEEPNLVDYDWVEIEEEVEEEVTRPSLVAGVPLPESSFQAVHSDDIDDEIREVFVEEVQDEIDNLNRHLPQWKSNTQDLEKLKTIRRSFHTLKGSGRLVGALALGEFSWKIENMLNRVLDGTIQASPRLIALLEQAVDVLPQILNALRNLGAPSADISAIMAVADRLAAGQQPEDTVPLTQTVKVKRKRWIQVPRPSVPTAHPSVSSEAPEELEMNRASTQGFLESMPERAQDQADASAMDPLLIDILRSEAGGHLQVIDAYLADARQTGSPALISEQLLRSVHTLHGAVSMADVPAINEMVGPLESYIKRLRGSSVAPTAHGVDTIEKARHLVSQVLVVLDKPEMSMPDASAVIADLIMLRDQLPEPENAYRVFEISVDDEDDELSSAMPAATGEQENTPLIEEISLSVDDVPNTTGEINHSVELESNEAQGSQILETKPLVVESSDDFVVDLATEDASVSQLDIPPIAEDKDPEGGLVLADVDEDLIEIFVEEGKDILDKSDALVASLNNSAKQLEAIQGLQRHLHTLKGNARAVGINAVGDLCHATESLLEAIVDERHDLNSVGIDALERSFDKLNRMVERVANRQAVANPKNLIARFEDLVSGDVVLVPSDRDLTEVQSQKNPEAEGALIERPAEASTIERLAEASAPPVVVATNDLKAKATMAPVQTAAATAVEDDAPTRAPQEMIRVRSDLLDALVNFAGEVSIYRSRLEQQIGSYRFNIVELGQTVERLRDQLRKLEIETEAQILSRYQREAEAGGEQFDPLELDRFSTQQQLSRALAESVSDLQALQSALDDLTRQSETLLLQQSRVSSELQEGLMRTRMVPFDSIVPFLRRLVRQTADELGKRANLRIEGAQGEMDRNLLERMKAPFEHMLRNALAHGIELPEERKLAGKPPEGTVSIIVSREATEVLLRVLDDGKGIDRDAIRRKAIERGLMRPDAQLSDRDLFAFIAETGFSTAEQITKVSGRGVGMDVVASEIKQLGGTFSINSQRGKGTEFTIRLPFTLAVTQAILVRMGEQIFAIPMSSVQGVARIARDELSSRLRQLNPVFSYAGEDYSIHELNTLLGSSEYRASDDAQLPLLLTKSGDQKGAVRVDAVMGSREVVVKSAGPQISSVPGIFGATIMGDGSVVLILDLTPLIRKSVALRTETNVESNLGAAQSPSQSEITIEKTVVQNRQPLIMVVDDSITMRKVTSRVLERNDMEVITAKDGLDALEKLQDKLPDLVLLDIEMPRMDGYELATYMRGDQRMKSVPIIMITSRTGEKHRQRAFEIGVERYLGKPYQEIDLLKNVEEVLGLKGA
jgi:chemosensory pili system protein ChpA (sensor histidine kinase/response regulator)